jgi:MGT family glycosyltransferase
VRFGEQQAAIEIPDMQKAIREIEPDVLLVDVVCPGASMVAAASGLPWAHSCPSPPMFRSADAPPYGLGFRPAHGPFGRLRDRVFTRIGDRILAPHVAPLNAMRASLDLPPLRTYDEQWYESDRFLLFTAEPYEFPRSDWPASVRLVGPGTWEPPAETPDWLAGETRPIVLVTASSAYQADERLITTALEAFADDDVALVATTAAIDPSTFNAPNNARVERFLAHGPIIARAACVVSHGGQGTTQRALSAGVPLCVVPFCRDQFDVARRVEVAGAGTRLHHKRLRPRRLRATVNEAMNMRTGAARIAQLFATTGRGRAAADAVEDLLHSAAPTPRTEDTSIRALKTKSGGSVGTTDAAPWAEERRDGR